MCLLTPNDDEQAEISAPSLFS